MTTKLLTVAIFKDDPGTAFGISKVFQLAGYHTVIVDTREKLFYHLDVLMADAPIDVIVAGENLYELGDMPYSGVQLIRDVRNHKNKCVRRIPMVMYTGYPWYREVIERQRQAGDRRTMHVSPMGSTTALLEAVKKQAEAALAQAL